MSYKKLPYTWGAKENSWIETSTGIQEGDTVWNTDWDIMETYTGVAWKHDKAVIRYSGGSDALQVGNLVEISNDGSVSLQTAGSEDLFGGVIIRGSALAGDTTTPLLVAYMGVFPVLYNTATTRGYFCQFSGAGLATPTSSISADCIGICVESVATSPFLAKTVIHTVEYA